MKSFFQNMNFVRGVMLICLIAAATLGYLGYKEKAYVADLEDKVDRAAGLLAHQVQERAVQLNQLKKLESGSEFESLEKTAAYIRQTAILKTVNVGEVDITENRAKDNVVPGTKDESWSIRPKERTTAFSRSQVANFLYMLEARSPFVVVTHAEFRLEKKGRPEEHPSDRWTYEADVTIRSPLN